jgi:hypothetical protein
MNKVMIKHNHYHAALAATILSCHPGAGRDPVISCARAVLSAPRSPVATSSNIMKSSASVRVLSGCVRVYPDRYSFYFLLTYYSCLSCPGENQHTHARARARGKSISYSDLLFVLLLKVPRQHGHLFNIAYFRSDIHPDALGQPGQAIIGGIS